MGKKIRLERDVYQEPGRVFSVTIPASTPVFANRSLAGAVWSVTINGALAESAELMAACLMPDHLHLLMGVKKENLIDLIGRWKRFTQRIAKGAGGRVTLWQKSFYDHALRRDEQISIVAQYIYENPVRKGLIEEGKTYPYRWHAWL